MRTIKEIKQKWYWFTIANAQILIDIEFGYFLKNRWHLHSLIFPIVVVSWLGNLCYVPELPFYFSIPISFVACVIFAWLVEVAEITYQNRNGHVRSIELNLEDWKDVIFTSYAGLLAIIFCVIGFKFSLIAFCSGVLIGAFYLIFRKE